MQSFAILNELILDMKKIGRVITFFFNNLFCIQKDCYC